MKVLITGYSGFVGSHLVEKLLAKYTIKLLGRSVPEYTCDFLYVPDFNSFNSTDYLFDVDVIIHVASLNNSLNGTSLPSIDIFRDINVNGTIKLAQQALNAGVKRFIYISTIKVIGDKTQLNMPFTIDSSLNPIGPYSVSKYEAEQALIKYLSNSNMEYVVIRPPLVYGKGVKSNFSSLFNLSSKGFPIPLGSFSSNKRSLVSVYNLVDLIEVCIGHPKAANQIFLVSDDDDISTTSMVKLMADVQGTKPFLVPIPIWLMKLLGKLIGNSNIVSRLTDSLRVDITHTQETLNWTPPFSVKEGFAKCIENKDV